MRLPQIQGGDKARWRDHLPGPISKNSSFACSECRRRRTASISALPIPRPRLCLATVIVSISASPAVSLVRTNPSALPGLPCGLATNPNTGSCNSRAANSPSLHALPNPSICSRAATSASSTRMGLMVRPAARISPKAPLFLDSLDSEANLRLGVRRPEIHRLRQIPRFGKCSQSGNCLDTGGS